MSVEMFDAIMDKIVRETPNVHYVGLFSWTEPLLHPELSRIVASVKDHSFPCHLSSNLNRVDHLEEVVAAQPDRFRVSLSGFYQSTYEQTHRGGDIEVVKANMRHLRAIMDKTNSKMKVTVSYHRYRHNMGEDYKKMQQYARQLGFTWEPVWAYLMPLEKILDYHEGRVTSEDRKIIDLLALSPAEQKELQKNTPARDCVLRAEQMSINADGSVSLCCGTFDNQYTISRSFLDTRFEELQRLKYGHALCATCMSHENHKTAVMSDPGRIDKVAFHNLGIKVPLSEKAWGILQRQIRVIRPKLALGERWRAVRGRVLLSTRPEKQIR